MSVANASIVAYRQHRAEGRIGPQQASIIGFLANNSRYDFSRRELADFLKMDLSSVCGRVNELLSVGLLIEATPRKCHRTLRLITPVTVAPFLVAGGAHGD